MGSRYPNNNNDAWMLQGSPSGFRTQNLEQYDCDADLSALTTQVMLSVAIPLQPGDVVTNITFVSGATAAGTPTNYWFALYSSAATPALLSQSADQLTAAWAANTVKTLALANPQLITVAGVYYAAVMVKATTPPTLIGKAVGVAGAAGSILSSKVLSQTSGSSLTTTAPATIATPTTVANIPMVILT